jgi:hypothetical protein
MQTNINVAVSETAHLIKSSRLLDYLKLQNAIEIQEKIIIKRAENISINPETGEIDENIFKSAKSAIEMEFKMSSTCWAKLFIVSDVHEDYAPTIYLNDILHCSKKKIPFTSFIIVPSPFHKNTFNLVVTSLNNERIVTSRILAIHTSSGTKSINGYHHINFLTKSGSIYYGSGEKYGNDESLKLINCLPMYLNY